MKTEQQKLGGELLISFLENTANYEEVEPWLGKENTALLKEVYFHMIPDTSSSLVLEQRLPDFEVTNEFLSWLKTNQNVEIITERFEKNNNN